MQHLVLAPGPVQLHPEVEKSLALPMIHHRTPEFVKILDQVWKKLQLVFQTEQRVLTLSSTGTGGMEALLVNLISPGSRVLAIDSGKFGERWAEMARVFGAELEIIKVKWGEAVELAEVEKHLGAKKFDLVLCQACETSTGVLHDIQALGSLIHNKSEALFLVDGITAVGAFSIPMDAWKIDGLVGGSQKAFMLPTGLSFVAFSERAWERSKLCKTPRFYFDLISERAANIKGDTGFSGSVSLIRALDVALDLMLKDGLESFWKNIQRRADFTRNFALKLQLKPYSNSPSPSLSVFKVPEGIDSQKLRDDLEKKYSITIMGGQDQLKSKVIRIGHMGFITDQDLIRSFQAIHQEFSSKYALKMLAWPALETEMLDWLTQHKM